MSVVKISYAMLQTAVWYGIAADIVFLHLSQSIREKTSNKVELTWYDGHSPALPALIVLSVCIPQSRQKLIQPMESKSSKEICRCWFMASRTMLLMKMARPTSSNPAGDDDRVHALSWPGGQLDQGRGSSLATCSRRILSINPNL